MKKITISPKVFEKMKIEEKYYFCDWKKIINAFAKYGEFEYLKLRKEVISMYFDEIIGYSDVITTCYSGNTILAKRIGEDKYSKFIKKERNKETNMICLVMEKKATDEFCVVDIILGDYNLEPEDEFNIVNEYYRSLDFWSSNAFCYDENLIQKDTIIEEKEFKEDRNKKFNQQTIYSDEAQKYIQDTLKQDVNSLDGKKLYRLVAEDKNLFKPSFTAVDIVCLSDELIPKETDIGTMLYCENLKMCFEEDYITGLYVQGPSPIPYVNYYKVKKENRNIKIIVSNRTKEHINEHKEDFLMDYNILLNEFEKSDVAKNIKDEFVKVEYEFDYNIGINKVITVTDNDEIIYAKRKNRDVYSKFTNKSQKGNLTRKMVIILKQNKYRKDEYYLVTIFPGEMSEKEPEDKTIKTEEERKRALEFWKTRAFVYDESIVQKDTVKKLCPYDYMAS